MVDSIRRHHEPTSTDAQLPPAIRLVSVLRETLPAEALEAFVELARSDYGLQADWLVDAVDSSGREASEIVETLA